MLYPAELRARILGISDLRLVALPSRLANEPHRRSESAFHRVPLGLRADMAVPLQYALALMSMIASIVDSGTPLRSVLRKTA